MVIVTTTTAWSSFSGYLSTAFVFAHYKKIKFLQFQVSNYVLGMFKRSTTFGLKEKLELSCEFANSFVFEWNYKDSMRFLFKSMSLECWTSRFPILKLLKYNPFWHNHSKITFKKSDHIGFSLQVNNFSLDWKKKFANICLWRKLGKPF